MSQFITTNVMLIKKFYQKDNQTIYNNDCLEILKEMPDNSVDLVLTDPPYGIEYQNEKTGRESSNKFDDIENDAGEIDYVDMFREFLRIGKMSIVFGANNFYKDIPHKGIWFCWDKRTKETADHILGSPFELAWCSKDGGYYKMYRVAHYGFISADKNEIKGRVHPTQKPVELMSRIIEDFSKESDTILDPFLGSGTTLVACKQLGRKGIGIEISEKYANIAKDRLAQDMLF